MSRLQQVKGETFFETQCRPTVVSYTYETVYIYGCSDSRYKDTRTVGGGRISTDAICAAVASGDRSLYTAAERVNTRAISSAMSAKATATRTAAVFAHFTTGRHVRKPYTHATVSSVPLQHGEYHAYSSM